MADFYYTRAYIASILTETKDSIQCILDLIEKGAALLESVTDRLSYYVFSSLFSIKDQAIRLIYNVKSLELARQSGNVVLQSQLLSTIGYYYMTQGEFDKSIEYFENAKDLCYKAEYPYELSMVYYNLSCIAFLMGNYSDTIENANKAIKLKKQYPATWTTEDWTSIYSPMTLRALALYCSGSKNEAAEYAEQIIKEYNVIIPECRVQLQLIIALTAGTELEGLIDKLRDINLPVVQHFIRIIEAR